MHICVGELTIIGSDNGLSPGWHQTIIWTNAGILSSGILGTNVSEILSEIHKFSFKKMHLKSGKWRPFCLSLNVLKKTSDQTDENPSLERIEFESNNIIFIKKMYWKILPAKCWPFYSGLNELNRRWFQFFILYLCVTNNYGLPWPCDIETCPQGICI